MFHESDKIDALIFLAIFNFRIYNYSETLALMELFRFQKPFKTINYENYRPIFFN